MMTYLLEASFMNVVAAGCFAPDDRLVILEVHEADWALAGDLLLVAVFDIVLDCVDRKRWSIGEEFVQLRVQEGGLV